MKNYLSHIKHKKFLGVLFAASVISVVYIVTYIKSPPPTEKLPSITTPTPTPELQLLNTFPPPGNFVRTFPNTALTYTFNTEVRSLEFNLQITPPTQVYITLSPDKKVLSAQPVEAWKLNIPYKISLTHTEKGLLTKYDLTFTSPALNPEITDDIPIF